MSDNIFIKNESKKTLKQDNSNDPLSSQVLIEFLLDAGIDHEEYQRYSSDLRQIVSGMCFKIQLNKDRCANLEKTHIDNFTLIEKLKRSLRYMRIEKMIPNSYIIALRNVMTSSADDLTSFESHKKDYDDHNAKLKEIIKKMEMLSEEIVKLYEECDRIAMIICSAKNEMSKQISMIDEVLQLMPQPPPPLPKRNDTRSSEPTLNLSSIHDVTSSGEFQQYEHASAPVSKTNTALSLILGYKDISADKPTYRPDKKVSHFNVMHTLSYNKRRPRGKRLADIKEVPTLPEKKKGLVDTLTDHMYDAMSWMNILGLKKRRSPAYPQGMSTI